MDYELTRALSNCKKEEKKNVDRCRSVRELEESVRCCTICNM